MTHELMVYWIASVVVVGLMGYLIGQARADARATRDLEELRRMM